MLTSQILLTDILSDIVEVLSKSLLNKLLYICFTYCDVGGIALWFDDQRFESGG